MIKKGISYVIFFLVFALVISIGGCSADNSWGQEDKETKDGKESKRKMSAAAAVFEKECERELTAIREAFEKLKKINGPKTVSSFLVPFNDIKILIHDTSRKVLLYQGVHPDAEIRSISSKYEKEIAKIETEINMSPQIFNSLKAIDLSSESADTCFYVEKLILQFKRAGLDKNPETRKKIKQLQEKITEMTQTFRRNLYEDVRSITLDSTEQLAGLPADYIKSHKPGEDGKITITTDYPDYHPFLMYSKSDAKRKELFLKKLNRGFPKNKDVLKKMMALRFQLAQLLGYKNWAHYNIEDNMIETSEAAAAFIQQVADIVEPSSKEDYKLLLDRLKKEQPGATQVGEWQYSYLNRLVMQEQYSFDSQKIRQYFPYKTVRQGVFDITRKLFEVTFKKTDIPVWHPSVEAYEMWDDKVLLGRFYMDMHPRENKFKHAAMLGLVIGIKDRQVPEGVLVCNFPGGDGSEGLMEHRDVITFFHEFGHLLHFIYAGKQRWAGNSGINTERDFIETPSILFQEWAWDPGCLKMFAKNAKGETIPDPLIEKVLKSRRFGYGLFARHQMFIAATSLQFHNQDKAEFDQLEVLKKLQARYSPFKYHEGTHRHLSSGHGYEAAYYTYMWSEVIVRDIFSRFKEKGLFDVETAKLYKEKVLAPGGSKKAADSLKDFLGREYSFEAFKRYLNE